MGRVARCREYVLSHNVNASILTITGVYGSAIDTTYTALQTGRDRPCDLGHDDGCSAWVNVVPHSREDHGGRLGARGRDYEYTLLAVRAVSIQL